MTKKYPTVAVLMGDRNNHELIRGFYYCVKREKVNLIFLIRSSIPKDTNNVLSDMTGDDFQVHFSSIYDYASLVKPDVLILAYGTLSSFSDAPDMEKLLDFYKDIPCILVKDISSNPDISHLNADNYTGMRECVEHLIVDHKYKRIGFVAGPKKNRDSNERLSAYLDAMREHGLEVLDGMVVHGDFSEVVDSKVRYLLDVHPDLEAIVFANDSMAMAGYRVCEERGLVVGQQIALTGFDDQDIAKTMNPPLTSIMYSSFMLSFQALRQAVEIYNGKKVTYEKVETVLHKRGSCGCSYGYDQIKFDHIADNGFAEYIYNHLDLMAEELFSYLPYEEVKQHFRELLVRFFEDFLGYILSGDLERYTFDTQFTYLKKLCDNIYISPTIILDHIVQLLRKMVASVEEDEVRSFILRVMASTQQYINANEIMSLKKKSKKDRHQNWFVNAFVQDLLVPEMSLEDGMYCILRRFQPMDIRKCYFFLYKKPIKGGKSYKLEVPDGLYLAASYDNGGFTSLLMDDWVAIDKERGIADYVSKDEGHIFTTYVLFSGNEQYGFMLCENEQQDTPFVTECSLQVGSFLRFCTLNASEQESRRELEASLKLIKEQNIILNSISEIDNLTNLLNRRGFMERAMHCINENTGKNAYMLFADLDHLKEINDTFGHQAGDYAIIVAADYLRKCMPDDTIIARIGGDEFVAFVVSDTKDFDFTIKEKIKQYSMTCNESNEKPYYIDISVGVHKCVCDSSIAITDLLQKSDELLYEEKKRRRVSVRK